MDTTEPLSKVLCSIDQRTSKLTVRAFASGLLSSFGHNPILVARQIEGEIEFTPDQPESTSFEMKIKADSLEVTNQDLNSKDKGEIEQAMKREVLETSRYPEIVFASTRVTGQKVFDGQYRVMITGNLTLHGVTREQSITANIRLIGEDLRAIGEFTVKQSDFRIKPVSAVGGALKVKDELKISFEVVAHQKK